MKNNDTVIINFVMSSKLRNLREAIKATRSVKTHRANRDYKRFNETYCDVLSTYFRLYPTERLLP